MAGGLIWTRCSTGGPAGAVGGDRAGSSTGGCTPGRVHPVPAPRTPSSVEYVGDGPASGLRPSTGPYIPALPPTLESQITSKKNLYKRPNRR